MSEHDGKRVVARNRKARHDYHILDQFEAGMVLKGTEVKSVRAGQVAFRDAFARIEGGEVFLHDLHISPYEQANRWNVEPDRVRKLLLHRSEIRKLTGRVEEKGLTLVPLEIYFVRGRAKVSLGLARGRKTYDKREKLKERAQQRDADRARREG